MDEINYEAIADYAITVLREGGWCKDSLGLPSQPLSTEAGTEHCAVGAVNLALSQGETSYWDWDSPVAAAVYAKLAGIIAGMYPGRAGEALRRWQERGGVQRASDVTAMANNHPDTTEDDIIAALEKLRSAAA